MSVFKASAHMRELKQRLSLLLPASSISESADSADQMPLLVVVSNGEHQHVKIEVDGNQGRVDGLGLPQRAYSPHICKLVQESAAPAGAQEASARAKVIAACAKLGMKLMIDQAAGVGAESNWADAVAAVAADGGAVKMSLPSDEINPLTSSQ